MIVAIMVCFSNDIYICKMQLFRIRRRQTHQEQQQVVFTNRKCQVYILIYKNMT